MRTPNMVCQQTTMKKFRELRSGIGNVIRIAPNDLSFSGVKSLKGKFFPLHSPKRTQNLTACHGRHLLQLRNQLRPSVRQVRDFLPSERHRSLNRNGVRSSQTPGSAEGPCHWIQRSGIESSDAACDEVRRSAHQPSAKARACS